MKEETVMILIVVLAVAVIALWVGYLIAHRQGKDHLKKVLNIILCLTCGFGFGFLLVVFSMGNLFIC